MSASEGSDPELTVWRDGELIPFADATVHVLSHAAHRGSEVFDVLKVYNTTGQPRALGLREHVARFERSMRLMGMASPYDVAALSEAVRVTVNANPGSVVVKLVAAWPDVVLTTRPASPTPMIVVTAQPGDEGAALASPLRVTASTMPKMPAEILPPSLKVAASYTAGLRQQMAADEAGFDDVVFRTVEGRLAEGTSMSLLVVKGDRLIGPPLDSVLDGITRRLVCELAADLDLAVEIRDVHWDEVEGADELFFSSTNKIVSPIAALDDHTYEAPGPVAKALGALADRLIADDHPLSGRWMTPLPATAPTG
ncbi:MAG: aminotransferase class IV [Actinomycetota bacterium]